MVSGAVYSPKPGHVLRYTGQCLLVGAGTKVNLVAPIDPVPSSQHLLIKAVLTTNRLCGWQRLRLRYLAWRGVHKPAQTCEGAGKTNCSV